MTWTKERHARLRHVLALATPTSRWCPRYHKCEQTGSYVPISGPHTESLEQAMNDAHAGAEARADLPGAMDEIERLEAKIEEMEYDHAEQMELDSMGDDSFLGPLDPR